MKLLLFFGLLLTSVSVRGCGPESCIEGFYLDNITAAIDGRFCKPCHSSCRECMGPNDSDCTGCFHGDARVKRAYLDSSFYCVDASVVDPTSDKYFVTPFDVDRSKNCHRGCQTCLGPLKSDCNGCAPGFIAVPSKDLEYFSIGETTFECVSLCFRPLEKCSFAPEIKLTPNPWLKSVLVLSCDESYYSDSHGICTCRFDTECTPDRFETSPLDEKNMLEHLAHVKKGAHLKDVIENLRPETGEHVESFFTASNCLMIAAIGVLLASIFCCFCCCNLGENVDRPGVVVLPRVSEQFLAYV